MPELEEKELENEELGTEEVAEKPQPEPELPADPNEPITIETDEAKLSRRRQARAERQNRYKEMESENQRLRREAEELRQRSYQPQYQPPQQQQEHPAAQRMRQIDDHERSLHREYQALAQAGKITPQLQEEFENKARQIQVARMATVAQASQPQIDRQAIVREALWANFTTQHADIFHDPNPNVQKWAWAEYHRRLAEGHADTQEMVEDILDQTRVKFGKTPRKLRGSRPDDNTKARFSGIPSRGGGGAPQGEDGVVHMTADYKRMARQAFGDYKDKKTGKPWTEQQMYQHWANGPGKKLMAMNKKTG